MRAPPALETRDELKKDAVDAIAERALIPLQLAGVLFALVQQQRLHDVRRHWIAGKIQVTVPERLQDA